MLGFEAKNLLTAKSTFENCKTLGEININYFDLTKINDYESINLIIQIFKQINFNKFFRYLQLFLRFN